jgi:transposase InsO family protein
MPWENLKVENLRLKLVKSFLKGEETMTDLCLENGISRKTGHKWLARYEKYGEEGLKDLSKAPHDPHIYYPKDTIDRAIDLKQKKLTWGPKKIVAKLEQIYPHEEWPSPTRLYHIFKEHNLVTKKRNKSRVPATAPLGDVNNCNETWSVDLKGWFLTGDGTKCEPLTITDNFSRYAIRCVHLNRHTVEYVWPVFADAFREFGLPNRMRSDNGPPFGSIGVGRLTGLSVNLIKAGVIPEWINPGHPEENGRHERFHSTLQQEVANPSKASLILQIQANSNFVDEYNFERPHEALSMKTPASVYTKSLRTWDGILRKPEYNTQEMIVRKVGQSGCLWLHQNEHYIGQTLTGEYVGLKTNEQGEYDVYYGPIYLGKLVKEGLEKPKVKRRRQR